MSESGSWTSRGSGSSVAKEPDKWVLLAGQGHKHGLHVGLALNCITFAFYNCFATTVSVFL